MLLIYSLNNDHFWILSIVCGGEFTSPSGVITSPFHPDNYPSQRTCTYVISQPKSTVIRAQFLDFDVEGSQNCNFDYVQIRDGPDVNSTIIGRYCGDPSHMPSPILSTLNYLWISFVTDGSVQNRGFKVVLKIYNQLQKLDHKMQLCLNILSNSTFHFHSSTTRPKRDTVEGILQTTKEQ